MMKASERLAQHYHVDDLPEASTQFTQLNMIIDRHWQGLPLSDWSLQHLLQKRLYALHSYIACQTSYSEFSRASQHEKADRIKEADLVRQQQEKDQLIKKLLKRRIRRLGKPRGKHVKQKKLL